MLSFIRRAECSLTASPHPPHLFSPASLKLFSIISLLEERRMKAPAPRLRHLLNGPCSDPFWQPLNCTWHTWSSFSLSNLNHLGGLLHPEVRLKGENMLRPCGWSSSPLSSTRGLRSLKSPFYCLRRNIIWNACFCSKIIQMKKLSFYPSGGTCPPTPDLSDQRRQGLQNYTSHSLLKITVTHKKKKKKESQAVCWQLQPWRWQSSFSKRHGLASCGMLLLSTEINSHLRVRRDFLFQTALAPCLVSLFTKQIRRRLKVENL